VNPQVEGGHHRLFHGQAADTDVIVASAKAYLAALNRLMQSFGLHKSASAADDAPERTG
jgi:2-isopropylmalate synthase